MDASPRRADAFAWVRTGLGASTTMLATAVIVGALVRVIAALTLSPHVDEPSSVLAAHMVADRGLPILPSGTPYLQGVTLSYLLQPFVLLGFGEIHHLYLMRMVLVLAGTATVYVAARLGRVISGDPTIGAIAALLVAFDPVSVQWSAHVRMYGLLQLLTFLLAWAWIRLLQGNTGWRHLGLVIGLFWLAVATHVGGGSLLGAGMALGAALVHGRGIVREWRVLVALAGSAAGSLTLMTLARMLGTSNAPVRESGPAPFWSFVGDNLLAPLAALDAVPRERVLERLTAGVTLYWLVPGLIVAVSTVLGSRLLLRRHAGDRVTRSGVLALLALYWTPIVLVVGFTVSPEVRYLMHMHLLGYVFVAVLTARWLRAAGRASGWRVPGALWRYGGVAAIALAIGAGLQWRLDNPVHQPDYNAAMAYVAEHHRPGEPVVVTLPPVGYLSVEEAARDDVYFLAGSEGFTRADRYTRWSADGRLIDYWVGADSIVSTRSLDALLEEYPTAWVIADDGRLDSDWISGGLIERVIRDEMFPVYRSEGGAVVYQSKPDDVRSSTGDDHQPGADQPIDESSLPHPTR
jgi:hypothetical protein